MSNYDVIIVGAGFAGLSAGLELKKNGKTFKIIEPREVVGGRVYNTFSKNNEIIELGGQWLGKLHKTALDLVKRYKLELYKTPQNKHSENHLYIYKGIKLDHLPESVEKVLDDIKEIANELDLNAPYTHPKAKIWDSITLADWLKETFSDIDRINLIGKNIAGNFLSCSADEVSLLQALFYIISNYSVDYLSSFRNGAQEYRIIGGMAKLSSSIADEIGYDNIALNEFVKEVKEENNQSYSIITSKQTYTAKHVIITAPPRKILDIKFSPELPKEYVDFYSGYLPGKAYKFPFWIW